VARDLCGTLRSFVALAIHAGRKGERHAADDQPTNVHGRLGDAGRPADCPRAGKKNEEKREERKEKAEEKKEEAKDKAEDARDNADDAVDRPGTERAEDRRQDRRRDAVKEN
jgi:hypothetical protein